MKKIFISHASKDEYIVGSIVDDILVGALAVKVSEIFCTTTDGTKIESGEDWRDSIREALQNAKITLLIITPNFKESEVCQCEMGAAWVTSSKVIPLIVYPINYSSVGIIQQPRQIENILDDKSLDRLRDIVQERLGIDPAEIKSDRWTTKKIEFQKKVKKHLAENPFFPPMSRDEFQNTIKQRDDFEHTVESLIAEKIELKAFIEELKKAKDANEIKKIETKHKKIDPMDEFSKLCKTVSEKLSNLSSIVRGLIYISHSGKDIRIRYEGWEEQIDDAISKDYIDEDLDVDWHTTKLMRNLDQALSDLSSFLIDKEEDEVFFQTYSEEFEAPLSMANIEFWEEAFNVGISIS